MKKFKKMGSEIGKPDGVLPFNGYTRERRSKDIIIPILGEVESAEDFLDFVAMIDMSNPEDPIILRVNSGGGSLAAIDYLLDTLGKCENPVILEASGTFASAVTLLADYVDEIYISDNCEILIHNAVFGEGGKHKDVVDAVLFADKMNKKLLNRYYEGMFTESEFNQLYEGKQFYMDNVEYLDRFKARQEFLQNKFKEQPEEHKCNCENCSCDEEDPTIRQSAEEMFEEAIPRMVQNSVQEGLSTTEELSNKLRDALNKARQNVNREL